MPEQSITEIWKPVVGYEGWYSVSNMGRVRRDAPGQGTFAPRVLTIHAHRPGYQLVTFSRDGKARHANTVHSVVAEAFMPPRPAGHQINHKNGNKRDNRLENLEYVTPKENTHHALRMGLSEVRGHANGRAILTEAEVIAIRHRCTVKDDTWKNIAAEYEISRGALRHIVRRTTWKHC